MDIKERFEKLKPRLKALAEKYPLVMAAVLIVGMLLGYVLGKWL